MKNIIKNFLTGLPIVIFIILAFGLIVFLAQFEITTYIVLFLGFILLAYAIGYLNNLSK
jgi:hypothetical protein